MTSGKHALPSVCCIGAISYDSDKQAHVMM